MSYCGPRGIPHSKFLNWPESDQDKAIAWMLDERSRCPNCGTRPEQWLDANGKHVEPPPYKATSALCGGCQALEDKRKEIPEDFRHRYQVFLVKADENESSSTGRNHRRPWEVH